MVLQRTFRCNAPVPAPSLRVSWWTLIPVWGIQGCGTNVVWFSLCPVWHRSAASPSSDNLRCFPSVSTKFPNSEGPSSDVGIFLLFSSPHQGAGLVLLSLLFLLPSVFHSTYLCLDPYSPFQWPRSSGNVQPVFWENCSICGCTSDASMEGDALHVHPLLHHIGTLRNIFPYSQILL